MMFKPSTIVQLHMQHYYSSTSYTTRDVFRRTRAAGIFFGPQTTILLILNTRVGGKSSVFSYNHPRRKVAGFIKRRNVPQRSFYFGFSAGFTAGIKALYIVYMKLLMYIVPGWSFYIRRDRWSGCRHVLHKRNNYCFHCTSVLFSAGDAYPWKWSSRRSSHWRNALQTATRSKDSASRGCIIMTFEALKSYISINNTALGTLVRIRYIYSVYKL